MQATLCLAPRRPIKAQAMRLSSWAPVLMGAGMAALHALRQVRRRPRRIEPLLLVGKCIFTRGIARSRGWKLEY